MQAAYRVTPVQVFEKRQCAYRVNSAIRQIGVKVIGFSKLVVKMVIVGFVPPIVGLMLDISRPRSDAGNVRFTVKHYSSIPSGWRRGHNISPTERVR